MPCLIWCSTFWGRKRLVHNRGQLFRFIILNLGINVHRNFAVLMPCQILNRFRICAGVNQIRDICVAQLVRSYLKNQDYTPHFHYALLFLPTSVFPCAEFSDRWYTGHRYAPLLILWRYTAILAWTAYMTADLHHDWQQRILKLQFLLLPIGNPLELKVAECPAVQILFSGRTR